jgi:hypothetical protein
MLKIYHNKKVLHTPPKGRRRRLYEYNILDIEIFVNIITKPPPQGEGFERVAYVRRSELRIGKKSNNKYKSLRIIYS